MKKHILCLCNRLLRAGRRAKTCQGWNYVQRQCWSLWVPRLKVRTLMPIWLVIKILHVYCCLIICCYQKSKFCLGWNYVQRQCWSFWVPTPEVGTLIPDWLVNQYFFMNKHVLCLCLIGFCVLKEKHKYV